MSRDITKSGGGALAEAPKLSPELRAILGKRKVVPDYGGDDGVAPGGGQFRDGVWDAPAWVDARERDEAGRARAAYEAQLRPAPVERIRDFLLMLWNATKHQNDTNWEAVASVYPMFLDAHPSWCFRPERLKLAAQTAFDWFPTVRELTEFMEPDRQAILALVANLKRVSETTTQAPASAGHAGRRAWAEGGAEDHAEYRGEKADRERRELVEIMRKRDEASGIVPVEASGFDRLPGESDGAWMSRMKAMRDENIDLGAKARRADEQRYRRAKEIEREERAAQTRRRTPPPTPDAMRAAYDATGIKARDVRDGQTASDDAQNTMSCGDGVGP
jgi:hypothetical protein